MVFVQPKAYKNLNFLQDLNITIIFSPFPYYVLKHVLRQRR